MKKFWKNKNKKETKCNCHHTGAGCGGGFYFLGFLGSLIYYLQQGEGFLGILKAIVWPVFLVMKLLGI